MRIENIFLEELRRIISERHRGYQTEIAKTLGIKTTTFSNMMCGRRGMDEDTRRKIANFVGINYETIIASGNMNPPVARISATAINEPPNVHPGPPIIKKIPVISWVQAGDWGEVVDQFQPGDADEWIETTATRHPNAFALVVDGDSMEPEFCDGDIITVDPGREAINGSYVIAKNGNKATFKQLVIDGPSVFLKPLNNRYPVKDMTGIEFKVVGVVVFKGKGY